MQIAISKLRMTDAIMCSLPGRMSTLISCGPPKWAFPHDGHPLPKLSWNPWHLVLCGAVGVTLGAPICGFVVFSSACRFLFWFSLLFSIILLIHFSQLEHTFWALIPLLSLLFSPFSSLSLFFPSLSPGVPGRICHVPELLSRSTVRGGARLHVPSPVVSHPLPHAQPSVRLHV